MESIIRNIEQLLIKNDYVIVPGLGGFVIQYQSARITSQGITPPLSIIGFNSRMDNNDGLLALEILREKNISYREAQNIISEEINAIKSELSLCNTVIFGKLGTFFLNEDKQTCFTPSAKTDFLPSNFGMRELYITQRTEKKKEITLTIPTTKGILRYAAVLLILLGIFLFSPRVGNSDSANYAGFIPKTIIPTSKPDILVEEAELEIPVEENIITPIPKLYHIVVCCLPALDTAERYCQELKSNSYDNAIVLPSVRTNRIVINSFPDKHTATTYLQGLRQDKRFKDAWLHKEFIEN